MRLQVAALLFALGAITSSAFGALPAVLTLSPASCVWHAGDNSSWSVSTLDESGWQRFVPGQQVLQSQLWIRCHIDLSSLEEYDEPALQIRLYAPYELYVDGQLIGSSGNLRSGSFLMNLVRQWPLPRSLPPLSTIALRT